MTMQGSIANRIYERATIGQPEPAVGMGVTVTWWSDRDAGTIIKVEQTRSETIVTVREDHFKRTDANGMSECQSYVYSSNPDGRIWYFGHNRAEPNSRWYEMYFNTKTKRWRRNRKGCGLILNRRNRYHDFSF